MPNAIYHYKKIMCEIFLLGKPSAHVFICLLSKVNIINYTMIKGQEKSGSIKYTTYSRLNTVMGDNTIDRASTGS